jgi:NADH dehydrogenase
VFVIGDLASHPGPDGKPLPGLAPVAMQQGEYVAGVIVRRVKGESPKGPFRYLDKGTMATIGRAKAVGESMGIKFTGYLAWLAWLFIHIMYLARFENRVLVLFQWFWNYVTRNRTARLITNARPAEERGA